jgi:hypothetical protein
MKIVTYLILEHGTIYAKTLDEYRAHGLPEDWDDFIWQDQPTKETAIARHDDALDAWRDDLNHGRELKDVY